MKSNNRDQASLWDMLDAAQVIFRTLHGKSKDELLADEMFLFAMERLIEIIGEAANRVSDAFQKSHPQIPWGDIIGMRNHLIHEYSDVDLDEVWDTLSRDIPPMIEQLKQILPKDQDRK